MNPLHATADALLRGYSRVAIDERGSYRLVRLARRLRPRTAWQGRWQTPAGLQLDLDLGIYPDCCMAFGLYELATVRLIRRLLRPGDHFVDAGANIGYVTLHGAQAVGPTGRVDAFEPVPQNRQRLMEHLRLNGLDERVHVHPVALADAPGSVTMHFYGGAEGGANHGSSSMFAGDVTPTAETEVPTVRLDDALPTGSAPRLIKVDVEGAEPLVVAGMTGLLTAANPPLIVGEVNPTQSGHAGFPATAWLERILKAQPRYQLYEITARLRRRSLRDLGDGQINVLLKPE